jgi:hypothetical protein
MTTQNHQEVINMRLDALEQDVKSLNQSVFNDNPSIKDRVFANELGISTVKESINSIAEIMREQVADKKKLTLVIWGGALAFIGSALTVILSTLIG